MSVVYQTLLLVLFLSACGTGKKKFTEQVPEDLVETFDIKENKFDKFKIESIPKPKPKKVATKKPKKKINKSLKLKKKEEVKVSPVKKIEIVEASKKVEFEKPDDYPKNFTSFDLKSKEIWKKFKPIGFPGEEFEFEISYFGLTPGFVKITTGALVKIADQRAYHFKAHLLSSSRYSVIYELDDVLESYVSVKDFQPIKYSLVQRESGQSVDDLQLFDPEKRKTFYWYKRLKKGKIKKDKKEVYTPGFFQDLFSVIFFVRGLPLKTHDTYEFPIMTRGKTWMVKMKVARRETIEVLDKDERAIRVETEARSITEPHKKKSYITFWYSDDSSRRLLELEAKIKLGSISGTLSSYKAGRPYRYTEEDSGLEDGTE
ncbi:MAG: DUF3108 domain-containing protein [Halobacteriovoraceae bacterium]|nr:DUF3108 domain-containing protein [Halobacteriovoraceae bacterium]